MITVIQANKRCVKYWRLYGRLCSSILQEQSRVIKKINNKYIHGNYSFNRLSIMCYQHSLILSGKGLKHIYSYLNL